MNVAKELVWLKGLLEDFGITSSQPNYTSKLHCDDLIINQSCTLHLTMFFMKRQNTLKLTTTISMQIQLGLA